MKDDLQEMPPEEPYEPTIEEIEDSQYLGSDREIEEFGDPDEFYDEGLGLDDDDEFEEFGDDYDDEAEDGLNEPYFLNSLSGEDIEMRTAVMLKSGMVALLCIRSAPQGAAICRVDPREPIPAVQLYDDPDAATNWYARSLESSKRNGWRIAYYGLPLRG
ncbi:MAG: hypothetical protein IPM50_12825 [Acidobacteriota bacterium]|nr:MAG: hypothetical protein IPM50_12825 [Acidobacteriota bacterium]